MTSQASYKYLPMLTNSIPDSGIEEVYKRLEDQGILRWLFFSGEVSSYEDFLKLVRDPLNLFYVVVDTEEQQLVSVFWLNSRTDINCSVHVAFFKNYLGKATKISRTVLKWLFSEIPDLESLLCFIPVINRIANRFTERVGWIKVGTVPKLIKEAKTSNIVAGVMYYITKDEV